MIYLDNAATTKINKEVLDSYQALLNAYYANPSSTHALGLKSDTFQIKARNQILDILHLNSREYEVIFTSGATEANNLFIKGVAFAYKGKGKHIITSKIEHPSVIETCKQLEELFGYEVTYLDVNNEGKIDLDELEKSIKKDTILVSIMFVNNETGVISDLVKIKEIMNRHKDVFFHSDVVQGFAKIPFNYSLLDAFTISSHKIHGLKGSGALIKRRNIRLVAINNGGSQESGYRAGTGNFPVNAMLAKTIRIAFENIKNHYDYVSKIYDYLYDELSKIDGILLNSIKGNSPYILNFSMKNKKGPIVMEALSKNNIYVSTVSACSSKKEAMSDVIYAMHKNEFRAQSSLRISLSFESTLDEAKTFISEFKKVYKSIV